MVDVEKECRWMVEVEVEMVKLDRCTKAPTEYFTGWKLPCIEFWGALLPPCRDSLRYIARIVAPVAGGRLRGAAEVTVTRPAFSELQVAISSHLRASTSPAVFMFDTGHFAPFSWPIAISSRPLKDFVIGFRSTGTFPTNALLSSLITSSSSTMSTTPFPVPNATVPYWRSQLHELDDFQSSETLPAEQDIVIIGAGYTGTALAHYLLDGLDDSSRPSITILEARQACSGATARNGKLRPPVQ